MSAFWSVMKREIEERRTLLFGALVLSLFPFGFALLPGTTQQDAAHYRLQFAALVATIAAAATAVAVGGSAIARDLAERRLSFYFERPISNWAIWGGKTAAAGALSVAVGAVILLPSVLTRLRQLWEAPAPLWLLPVAAICLFALIGLVHLLSVSARIRSYWLLLDIAGIGMVSWIASQARAPLVRAGIPGMDALRAGIPGLLELRPTVLNGGYLALAGLLALAALVGGRIQISTARTDPRRGHRVLSLTFWGAALAVALGFLGFSHWVLAVEPGDLAKIETVTAAPDGPWVFLTGPARHRPGLPLFFLFDTATGRSFQIAADGVRVGAFETQGVRSITSGPRIAGGYLPESFSPFSVDGSRALWLEPLNSSSYRVISLDLTESASRPVDTPLEIVDPVLVAPLTRDSSRLAVIESESDRLQVYEIRSGHLLASENIDSSGYTLLAGTKEGCLTLEVQKSSGPLRTRVCNPFGSLMPDRPQALGAGGRPPASAGMSLPALRAVSGAARARPGSPATRLFFNERELVRIDPETGQRTVVLRLA